MSPILLFRLAWGLFILSWIAAAFWSSPAVKQSPPKESLRSNLLIMVGAILLFSGASRFLHAGRLWHVGYDGAYALAAGVVAGFLFAWWARIALGKLWSVQITRKEDHRVIDSGPYAIVRHPIYTGLIAATLFTAAAQPTALAIIGAALITFGLWLKARLEEQFLIRELGAEAYAAYSARVPMLLPFGPR
jgi:protein-S-isoprenylcysteine O-methyltransferase Ste14